MKLISFRCPIVRENRKSLGWIVGLSLAEKNLHCKNHDRSMRIKMDVPLDYHASHVHIRRVVVGRLYLRVGVQIVLFKVDLFE